MILRHIGDDLGLALVGNRDNRLTLGDDLSGFETHGGNDTARDARSTVYFSRLRASSSCRAAASAVADAVS